MSKNERVEDLGSDEHRTPCIQKVAIALLEEKIEKLIPITDKVQSIQETLVALPLAIAEQISKKEEERLKALTRVTRALTWVLGSLLAVGTIVKFIYDFFSKNKINL